ncbi:MAG: hypothetical protein R3Y63_08820 [Eubacteriales bacterium]
MIKPSYAIQGCDIFETFHDVLYRPFPEEPDEKRLEWAYLQGETYVIRRKGQDENSPVVMLNARSPQKALTAYRAEFGELIQAIKPHGETFDDDITIFFCGSKDCKMSICDNQDGFPKFCPWCGVQLDWSGVE